MACTIDFRSLDEGFGGKTSKRKRAEQEAEKLKLLNPPSEDDGMDVDNGNPPPSKRQAVPSSDDPNKPVASSFGKPTYDGVIAGKVSGRKWKQARTRRSSAVQEMQIVVAECCLLVNSRLVRALTELSSENIASLA
ncbi:hypothetical protein Fot_21886 [Forsythia ovata]|uniref:Coiled-coil domain-containing protein 86 n=1 Tax=Forsythia ovata TaxID=205694 RepID=A0ABD1UW57_9LAMI